MGRVIIKPRARRDLNEIWDYIADISSPDQADAFLDKIQQKIAVLSSQPRSGSTRNELRQGMWSARIERYVIFYRPLRDGVDVLRVLYGGRDFTAIFK